jgi:protein TonB
MAAKYQSTEPDRPSAAAGDPLGSEGVHDILEHRTQLDRTLPPTPLKDLLSAGGANVFVLSSDRDLLDTVQRAGGEQYPVFMVEEWTELDAAVKAGRCGIALLDADQVGNRLEKRLAELEPYAARLVILVAANRSDAQLLMGFLSDRKIHRLLIKPPALGITRLLLESAVSRCIQLREQAKQQDDFVTERRFAASGRSAPGPSRWPNWVIATGLVSLLIGVLGVAGLTESLWFSSEPAPEPRVTFPNANQRSSENSTAARSSPRARGEAASPGFAETSGDPVIMPGGPIDDAAPAGTDSGAAAAETVSAAEAPIAGPQPSEAVFVPAAGPDASAARADRSAASISASEIVAGAPASSSDAPTRDRFERLLAGAGEAFKEGRLAEPSGDNALDYYLTILAVDPDHAEAREQLETVVDALFTQAEAAMLDDSLDAAAAVLEHLERADSGSARLVFLQTQLDRSRARAAEELAAASAVTAPAAGRAVEPLQGAVPAAATQTPSELDSLLMIAAARIERGQLLQPAGDSAREYIERAATLDAGDERVASARAQLAAAVAASARVAFRAGDLVQAAQLLEAARGLGAGPDDSWRELAQALATSASAAIDNREWTVAESWLDALSRIAGDSAAVRELGQRLKTSRLQEQYLASVVPASALRVLEYAPPTYPVNALRREIAGWVELEFIVGADGRPRELVAVQAEPAGFFEQAAIEAVADYRYAPFELDGKVYERRLRLRLRFTLE